ncbi:MAG: hypothetical protein ABI520_14680 [Caldimonas sp.]
MAPGSCRRQAIGLIASALLCAAATPPGAAESGADPTLAAAKRRVERADYQLLYKYPDRETYLRLKRAEVDVVMGHLHQAGLRLNELVAQLKVLIEKAEFYKGKALPADLQADVDANGASFTASMYVFEKLEQDVANIVAKYEHPRARLEQLWAGAALGSMGPLDPEPAASSAK